jgi:hypothetical protein
LVFDTVRELLQDEASVGENNALRRYLRPDLLIIDDMGLKQLPHKAGECLFEIVMRRYEVRSLKPADRGMGEASGRRPVRNGHSGQVLAPRGDREYHREELPLTRSNLQKGFPGAKIRAGGGDI